MARFLACRIINPVLTEDCAAGKRIGKQSNLVEASVIVYIAAHMRLGTFF